MKLIKQSEGNLFLFLKLVRGIYPKLTKNNIQLLVNYTLHEPTFIVSYSQGLGLSINFLKLVIHNIDIVLETKYLIKLKW